MRVKKFEAKSMKDALRMIKMELGPEAVILGARENRRGFGLNGETSFEVTAAVSEPTLQKKNFVESRLRPEDREKFRQANARAQKTMIEKMVEKRVRTLPEAFQYQAQRSSIRGNAAAATGSASTSSSSPRTQQLQALAQGTPGPVRPRTQTNYIDITDEDTLTPESVQTAVAPAVGTRNSAAAAPVESSTEVERLREEIRRLQATVAQASAAANASTSSSAVANSGASASPSSSNAASSPSSGISGAGYPGAKYGLSFDFSATYSRLVQAGMGEGLVAEILRRAMQEIDPIQSKKKSLVDAWVAKWLLTHISVLERPFAARTHVFVGPVGSGKTAHLVKAAAQLVIRDRKRIAIVTTDTSKVGAVDQLKIYSQILNVPFAVVRDRSDWEIIDRELAHVDHILVDTTGSSLGELEDIQAIKQTLPKGSNAVHLCLQATMKESDALETVRRFRALQPTDLVFSSVDLSVQHGVIATVQLSSGLSLHSFGTGPRIPEDFEIATRERVLDLLFKLSTVRSASLDPQAQA